MKNSIVIAVAVAALAGCQVGTPPTTGQTEEALRSPYCGESFPAEKPWTGTLPPTPSTTVVLMLRKQPSVWWAVGADMAAGKLIWVLAMSAAQVGGFQATLEANLLAYGGVRPPPGAGCPTVCGDDWAAFFLEAGARIAPIFDQAWEARKSCKTGP